MLIDFKNNRVIVDDFNDLKIKSYQPFKVYHKGFEFESIM